MIADTPDVAKIAAMRVQLDLAARRMDKFLGRCDAFTVTSARALLDAFDAHVRDLDQANARADEAERLIAEKDAEIARLKGERDDARKLVAYLTLQAETWAQEARTQESTVHEAYQAATGATGEPGDWNGAKPVIEALDKLRARATAAETARDAALERVRALCERLGEVTTIAERLSADVPCHAGVYRSIEAAARALADAKEMRESGADGG